MQTHVLFLGLGALAMLAVVVVVFRAVWRNSFSKINLKMRTIELRTSSNNAPGPKRAKWSEKWPFSSKRKGLGAERPNPPATFPEPMSNPSASAPRQANSDSALGGRTMPVLPHGEKVQFTCGYPGAVSANEWYNLLLYVHLAERAQDVRNLLEKQSAEIGSEPMTSGAIAARTITRGTRLKLVPELKGFRFNPPSMELDWLEDVQQVRFRIMAGDDLAGSSSLGAIDIYAAGLLIAQVPLSVRVLQPGEPETAESQIILARMFEKVFASYSHKDKAVVDACCALSKSMGISMFVDSASLLSGDDWEKKLHEAIRNSDVFQLFWSPNSSASKEVEKEWRAALGLVGEKTERFIRPLYWLQPLPTVPRELNAFHFAQLPLESMIELLSRTATSGG
jgi:hypothetical protein